MDENIYVMFLFLYILSLISGGYILNVLFFLHKEDDDVFKIKEESEFEKKEKHFHAYKNYYFDKLIMKQNENKQNENKNKNEKDENEKDENKNKNEKDENEKDENEKDEKKDNKNEKIKRNVNHLFVLENTPVGNVIMGYDEIKESFYYYSDVNIPYVFLEVVARKFVLQNDCVELYSVMNEKKFLRENPKGKIFAKFKKYNEKKENAIIIKKMNNYINKGKIANFSFLQKIVYQKPVEINYSTYKYKMKHNMKYDNINQFSNNSLENATINQFSDNQFEYETINQFF